jgi:hypothetical protein
MSQSASQAAAFYREVATNQRLWTIRDAAGFPAPTDSRGKRAQPFWSSASRVERAIANVPAYRSFVAHEITWQEFQDRWVPGLTRDGHRVGLNWSGPRATGYDLDPADVVRNVEAARMHQ